MAVKGRIKILTPWDASGIRLCRWSGLANGDSGEPMNSPHFADRSVQVKGTFGTGGAVIIEGSNDLESESPTYVTLTDPQGNALSFTAGGMEQILQSSYLIRPRVIAGDGTTDLIVTILVRR